MLFVVYAGCARSLMGNIPRSLQFNPSSTKMYDENLSSSTSKDNRSSEIKEI